MPEEVRITDNAFDMITPYQRWLQQEGLPVIRGYHVDDLKTVEVQRHPCDHARE